MMVDDPKHSRSTRRFDSDQLLKLTREAGADSDRESADAPFAPDAPSDALAASRTATMHDPLTMALLAEAARTSRTVEIDPSKIERATAMAAAPEDVAVEPTAHPRIKRR